MADIVTGADPDEPVIPDSDDADDDENEDTQPDQGVSTPFQAAQSEDDVNSSVPTPAGGAGFMGFIETVWQRIEALGHIATNLRSEAGVAKNQGGGDTAHSDALHQLAGQLTEAHQALHAIASEALGRPPSQAVSATGATAGTVPSGTTPTEPGTTSEGDAPAE